jgi:hypothetical protein
MKLRPAVHLMLTALVAIVVAAPAFGAGEPKNQLPFDRQAHSRPTVAQVTLVTTGIVPMGEAKNEGPFTAPFSADPGYVSALREAVTMVLRN